MYSLRSVWSPGRKSRESSDPYYDMLEDWDLLVSSFLSQYGIRIQTKEFESVAWDEFRSLIAGLAPDTALGRVVAIRAETDPEILKHFTPEQMRIRREWKERESGRAGRMSEKDFQKGMADLERMFAAMCG